MRGSRHLQLTLFFHHHIQNGWQKGFAEEIIHFLCSRCMLCFSIFIHVYYALLDNTSIVLFNREGVSYMEIPLTNYRTDSGGYFVVGTSSVSPRSQYANSFASGNGVLTSHMLILSFFQSVNYCLEQCFRSQYNHIWHILFLWHLKNSLCEGYKSLMQFKCCLRSLNHGIQPWQYVENTTTHKTVTWNKCMRIALMMCLISSQVTETEITQLSLFYRKIKSYV